MEPTALEIRVPDSASGMAAVASVLQRVWGSAAPLVSTELLRANGHSGGYVAAAFVDGEIVGASYAFPALYEGELALHSHVTGVVAGARESGAGRALKLHQRAWAAQRGLRWITWTFDPLVATNAYFNLEVLGASVTEYLIDFYGPIANAIDADQETDRLLTVWPTEPGQRRRPPAVGPTLTVEIPPDIVEVRRSDPALALDWRHRVRRALGGAIDRGDTIVGFDRRRGYIVHPH